MIVCAFSSFTRHPTNTFLSPSSPPASQADDVIVDAGASPCSTPALSPVSSTTHPTPCAPSSLRTPHLASHSSCCQCWTRSTSPQLQQQASERTERDARVNSNNQSNHNSNPGSNGGDSGSNKSEHGEGKSSASGTPNVLRSGSLARVGKGKATLCCFGENYLSKCEQRFASLWNISDHRQNMALVVSGNTWVYGVRHQHILEGCEQDCRRAAVMFNWMCTVSGSTK